MTKIAVLGPKYSYTHIAADQQFPSAVFDYCRTIAEVFDKVERGQTEKGVVPIENMLEGSVRETVRLFGHRQVHITTELIKPINHCLAARNELFSTIASHRQALAQCSEFLKGKSVKEANSTSEAMKLAAENEQYAAIGSKEAAEANNLSIQAENIMDRQGNKTCFLVIEQDQKDIAQNASKTSLLIIPHSDRPGLLADILTIFKIKNINLTRIESIPTGEKMGEYVFAVDIDGTIEEERIKKAIDFLRTITEVKIFGSYDVIELA